MTDRVTVNRDRTALLPPNSPQKGYRITREEAAELGLVDSPDKPKQERRAAFDATAAKTAPAPKKQTRRSAKRK
jgi:enoyl-CoA hydratase/carnithine racemase